MGAASWSLGIIVLALVGQAAPAAVAAAPGLAGDGRGLRLEDCIYAAVVNNLDLERARLASRRAALATDAARATFWPVLFLAGSYADARTAGVDDAARSATGTLDTGVAVRTPIGTRLEAAVSNARRHSGDPDVDPDPAHSARLELRLDQPLLAGFGVAVNTAELAGSRWHSAALRHELRANLNALLRDTAHAYWNLVLAQREAALKARSLERARKQYRQTAENIRRGLLPAHDIHVVEESMVSFERKHLDARDAVAAARSALGRQLQLAPAQADGLEAIDAPALQPEPLAPLETQLAAALADQPDLAALRARAAAARVQLVYERNARLPRLDLEASLALNGVGASAGAGVEELAAGDGHAAYVGLRLEVPLFDLLDDARVVRARLEVRRRLLELEAAEQELVHTICDLRREIRHGRRSYALARRVAALAQAKLDAQQGKYRAGVAALKDLVQFLRELDEAEIEQVRTLVALQQRRAALHAAVGDLHRRWGIDVE
jgi:outer membrane protein TolC